MTVNFDPTRRDVQLNPYPHYRRLRDEAPAYYIPALGAYALTRYEDCMQEHFPAPGALFGQGLHQASVR